MNPFAHFILTRFNVPPNLPPPPESPSESPAEPSPAPAWLDAAWLARRFEWFERICLPSVDGQTEGAFQWLVFLDWATPMAFKEKMAALCVHYDCLRPVYCSHFDAATALAEIRRREKPDKVRITTSLDSDDALHPRMIECVQELARTKLGAMDLLRGFFISFPLGCCAREGKFYLQRRRDNPFMSFVSSAECGRTVLGPRAEEPVLAKCARPLWCQVLHADQAGARLRGLYWPGGRSSAFAPVVMDDAPR